MENNSYPDFMRRRVVLVHGKWDTRQGQPALRYDTRPLADIFASADNPQTLPKLEADGFLASMHNGHLARESQEQQTHGEFVMLRVDVDEGNHDLAAIRAALVGVVPDECALLIYATTSSMPHDRRWRVIVPIAQVLTHTDWNLAQRALAERMTERGIVCDTSMQRANQYIIGPNRGEHYEYLRQHGEAFDLVTLGERMTALSRADAELAQVAAQPRERSGFIVAWNAANPLADVLKLVGFETRNGRDYRHPDQTSKSYSTRTYENGRWVSMSGSLQSWGVGAVSQRGGAIYGDAWDLWVWFMYQGDMSAAVEAEAKTLVVTDAETGELMTWHEKTRREYLDAKESAPRTYVGNVQSINELLDAPLVVDYVWQHIFSSGCLYGLTGNPGAGKTAVSLYLAVKLALGEPIMERKTKPCRVLYLCGENPQDVRLRTEVMLLDMGIDRDALADRIHFTRRPFAIDDQKVLAQFVEDAQAFGPFEMVFIDTGPAHSSADDENDNRAQHELAMAMRRLMEPLGMPCTVALMHPGKGAKREGLTPRGGSSFTGSVDGLLCLWSSGRGEPVELFPHEKFRGQHFDSLWFDLEPKRHPTVIDNFGDGVWTVVAKPADGPAVNQRVEVLDNLTPSIRHGLLHFIGALEATGDWVGLSTGGPNANNPFRKSYELHQAFPQVLLNASPELKRHTFKVIEAMTRDGLLVCERRAAKAGQSQRDWPMALWLTEKAKAELLEEV